MGDQSIKLRWAGQGSIISDNITPVSLVLKKKLSVQPSPEIATDNQNMIIEGDNAPVMKSLCSGVFGLRGKVDFMLWDPPYNTGNSGASGFIYEDNFYLTKEQQQKWIEKNGKGFVDLKSTAIDGVLKTSAGKRDPLWVKETDASKHSKWLSWMEVRLDLAKKLLKKSGVIAVHIGFQELFRLGLLMDEVFGEENRLGIINWQCTGSSKNTRKGGIASSTDYILIYAKEKDQAYVKGLERSEQMESAYIQDCENEEFWRQGDLSTSIGGGQSLKYGIENPMTGELFFPPNARHWSMSAEKAVKHLVGWGVAYHIEKTTGNIVTDGVDRAAAYDVQRKSEAGEIARPTIYFSNKRGSRGRGNGQPLLKRYRKEVGKEHITPQTFWPYDEIAESDSRDGNDQNSIALTNEISGANRSGKKMIQDILGEDGTFDTVKPLKLTKKLVALFCPEDGIVIDAFAGSGTTGHAVLSLNSEAREAYEPERKSEDVGGASEPAKQRRFVLIERGVGSKINYADTITAERIRRVISGRWASPRKKNGESQHIFKTEGGFLYYKEGRPISAESILLSKRADLIDIIMTSHIGSEIIENAGGDGYVIGKTASGTAIALIWDISEGEDHGVLTREKHLEIMKEAASYGLKKPVYIYGTVNAGPNGSPSYYFNQIPDEILAALGINNN